ncbi:hypothetical protein A6K26_009095 [Gammaproteobacteria bacterium 2W06]|nr:hypothetical protein A6K26_009095 [Gammaproteobacteria bacterium 2W06]
MDTHGFAILNRLRLEQERIAFGAVQRAVAAIAGAPMGTNCKI